MSARWCRTFRRRSPACRGCPGTEAFAALIAASRQAETGGKPVSGVYYITSADLIHWTKPKRLLAVPIMFAFSCDAASAHAYPSLLDESSALRNFETVGGEAFLYLTRINVRACRLTMERDLVRYRLYLR
jgi:hypothetical protein